MGQRLGVNVDHVATLRQARRVSYPDPVTAAALAELAGAGQITIHLREDRRHIQERDLRILRETVQTLLNLEMAATQDMVKIAYEHKPDVVTLVPERREELTTEGGLEVNGQKDALAKTIKNLKDGEITVSLFIDPDLDQVRASHKVNADRIELHTGRYCEARNEREREREFSRIVDAAKAGARLGMGVAAGHGLNYDNVRPIARIQEIDELNIGHAIVARAVLVGFERAVREMLELMRNPG
ncbi:Pyridoxine 5'-phosphate synthase [Cystobacter fuscus DSM 2262]|jgi:pyridoxine 5-phosphate synthase|uniref:Pyridoxine 5'-phosphate synthase n=1 Tax=Cystobacter fuscus (strain ATCC 25194 / DSM 2262 / NBRC 100088 / M29) TaxID=1242864 RepID=S9P562_CYSF2|nr:pyridoxine 5'-phosphate synthase [Cystobacter fuscus]EPX57357.1 Pyridoxine 5'-phosphate synthase [Cystobacter fuscus DSM 2262]WNG27548.1 pyridoxine 5'-phosphate synthase [Cystobacter fuscus]